MQKLHNPEHCNTADNWKFVSGMHLEAKRQAAVSRRLAANPADALPAVADLSTADMRTLLIAVNEQLQKKAGVNVPFNRGYQALRDAMGDMCYWPPRTAESDPPLGAAGALVTRLLVRLPSHNAWHTHAFAAAIKILIKRLPCFHQLHICRRCTKQL